MIKEIESHFQKEYPKEGCGLLIEKHQKTKWLPCTNVAERGEDFIIDPQEYINLVKRYKIVGIVHSHPDLPCEASENDKRYCDFLGIPYYIFSYPSMELEILEPKERVVSIIGRKYENFA